MTNEEALKYLDEHCTASVIPFEIKVLCSNALEKQIPKKPNRTSRPYVCPICAKPIVVEANELPNHCYQCGQRLEWG